MSQLPALFEAGDDEVSFSWNVTQDDIDHGERNACFSCPIARSLAREFPGCIAEVDMSTLTIYELDPVTDGPGRTLWIAKTPAHAEDFIYDFDEDEPVAPLTITALFRRAA